MSERPHLMGHPRGWAYVYLGVVGIGKTHSAAQADWLWRYELHEAAREAIHAKP